MYDVSGDFGQVRIIRNIVPQASSKIFDYYLSAGWHNCNSLYHINKPQGNRGILIIFTVEGTGTLIYNNKRYSLKNNTVAIVPPNEACEYFTPKNKKWQFYWIHLESNSSIKLINYLVKEKGYVFNILNISTVISRIEQILTGYMNDLDTSRIISQVIYDLLENTNLNTNNRSQESDIVDRVIKYINDNYKDDITINDISNKLYISPDHLIRVFKRETGYTPYNYLKNFRMLKACDLLSFSKMSIKQISIEIGYRSESSFIAQFKSFKGMAPNEYRHQKPYNI